MTAPEPRIAVVIPCYGDGTLLLEALASLAQQEPCEVVVVDDGSRDRATLAVLDHLESDGVTVLRADHGGPSAARNVGLAATTARYVLPLDADDVVAPWSLTPLADLLDADDDLALAWGALRHVVDGTAPPPARLRATELDPWRITYLNELPGAALVRRSALEPVGGWRDGTGYEDWDLWLALAERGHRGAGIPVLVQDHRLHAGRRWQSVIGHHGSATRELRRAHPDLYARRRTTRRASSSSRVVKVLLPLSASLPLRARDRWRLAHLLMQPAAVREELARRLLGPADGPQVPLVLEVPRA